MVCTGCGAEANASCNCGVAYQPKAIRAAEAVKASPEKSNVAIAKDIGVDEKTVRKARAELPTSDQSEVEKRTGRDGKVRKLPERKPEPEEEDDDNDRDDAEIVGKDAFLQNANAAKELASYSGPFDDEMQEAAGHAADAWASYAGDKTKWKTQFDGWAEAYERQRKLEAHNNVLSEALTAKEAEAARNWPVKMTPKEVNRRDKILMNIAAWQRDLEQLYGEVTGQPSWRVEITDQRR